MQGQITNYLTSGLEAAKRFGKEAINELNQNLYRASVTALIS